MAWIAGSGSVTRHAKRAIAFRFFAHGPGVPWSFYSACPNPLVSAPASGSAAPVAPPLLLFVCRVTCGCGWVFLHLCHGLASSVVVLSLPSVPPWYPIFPSCAAVPLRVWLLHSALCVCAPEGCAHVRVTRCACCASVVGVPSAHVRGSLGCSGVSPVSYVACLDSVAASCRCPLPRTCAELCCVACAELCWVACLASAPWHRCLLVPSQPTTRTEPPPMT